MMLRLVLLISLAVAFVAAGSPSPTPAPTAMLPPIKKTGLPFSYFCGDTTNGSPDVGITCRQGRDVSNPLVNAAIDFQCTHVKSDIGAAQNWLCCPKTGDFSGAKGDACTVDQDCCSGHCISASESVATGLTAGTCGEPSGLSECLTIESSTATPCAFKAAEQDGTTTCCIRTLCKNYDGQGNGECVPYGELVTGEQCTSDSQCHSDLLCGFDGRCGPMGMIVTAPPSPSPTFAPFTPNPSTPPSPAPSVPATTTAPFLIFTLGPATTTNTATFTTTPSVPCNGDVCCEFNRCASSARRKRDYFDYASEIAALMADIDELKRVIA